jgi:hypothetical protein
MSRMTTSALAVSADYADALLTARRARSWAFLLLMLFLILQIAIFFLVRYDVIKVGGADAGPAVRASVDVPTTNESGDTHITPVTTATTKIRMDRVAAYATGIIVFIGMALSIVLAIILLMIVQTMLQGRLLGVAHVTSGFVWAVVLIALLMPWQRFYSETTGDDFRLPGVLYTWPELSRDAHFSHDNMGAAILKYVRFVGAPLAALIVLFMVQAKSGRGLKYALGEADLHVDIATSDV